jgi:hypothetical protein
MESEPFSVLPPSHTHEIEDEEVQLSHKPTILLGHASNFLTNGWKFVSNKNFVPLLEYKFAKLKSPRGVITEVDAFHHIFDEEVIEFLTVSTFSNNLILSGYCKQKTHSIEL